MPEPEPEKARTTSGANERKRLIFGAPVRAIQRAVQPARESGRRSEILAVSQEPCSVSRPWLTGRVYSNKFVKPKPRCCAKLRSATSDSCRIRVHRNAQS